MEKRINTTVKDNGIHFLDYARVVRLKMPVVILIFLLVVVTTGVYSYFSPRIYQSSVVMEVEQDDQNMRIFADEGGGRLVSDPRFATTQFQIIQRKEMLYPVIENLGLVQRWGKDGIRSLADAYFKLKSMTDVREVRNTSLIQITVESTDPNEAADIANAIAEHYQMKRIENQSEMISNALSSLRKEVEKQRERVVEAGREMVRLRNEMGITDLNPDSIEDPLEALESTLVDQEAMVGEARMEAISLRTKYDEIQKLSGEDLIRSLTGLGIEDHTVSSILPQYQETEAELSKAMQSGFGKKHPAIQSLVAKKQAYEKQLLSQVDSIKKTLAANLEITEKSLLTIENQLLMSRETHRNAKERSGDYGKAKTAYIQSKKILEDAEARLSTETMQRSMPLSPARIWERAEASSFPYKPNVFFNMIVAVFIGLVTGIGVAFFLEYLDTSVKTLEEVERFLNSPVLAVIPKNMGLLSRGDDDAGGIEPYRMLKTNLEFNRRSPEDNSVAFVSGMAGEGKSTTVANLACAFAQGGYRAVVVDADLRRPTQHRIFSISNNKGLSYFLTSDAEIREVVVETSYPNLSVVPSGQLPPDAASALNSQRMLDFVRQVKSAFDIVLFDSPPILGVSDASILVRAADLTIMVVQHRRFPRSLLRRVKQAIDNARGSLLGVVMNNVDVRRDDNYGYYTGYYAYRDNKERDLGLLQGGRRGGGSKTSSQDDY